MFHKNTYKETTEQLIAEWFFGRVQRWKAVTQKLLVFLHAESKQLKNDFLKTTPLTRQQKYPKIKMFYKRHTSSFQWKQQNNAEGN